MFIGGVLSKERLAELNAELGFIRPGGGTLLFGEGAITPIITDTAATIASHPTSTSTIINLSSAYESGDVVKGDLVIIYVAGAVENLGLYFVVGRFPEDVLATQIEIDKYITLSDTVSLKIYRNAIAVDDNGMIVSKSTIPSGLSGSVANVNFETAFSTGPVQTAFRIGIIGAGADPDNEYAIRVYPYDYLGASTFKVYADGRGYYYDTLTLNGYSGTALSALNNVAVAKDQDATTKLWVTNNNSTGTAAQAEVAAGLSPSAASWSFRMAVAGAGNTASSPWSPKTGMLISGSNLSGGIRIATTATGDDAGVSTYTANNKLRSVVTTSGVHKFHSATTISSFSGTISSSGTTATFSSAADAILAGYSSTKPVIGGQIVVAGQARAVQSWTDATHAVLNMAPNPAWSTDTITSIQLPIAVFLKSDGTMGKKISGNGVIAPRVVTAADDATAVIDVTSTEIYELTAIANNTEFTLSGTPVDGQELMIRIKDAGVSKNLTWTGFTPIGVTLPAATTAGKWHYVKIQYNLAAGQWHVLDVKEQV